MPDEKDELQKYVRGQGLEVIRFKERITTELKGAHLRFSQYLENPEEKFSSRQMKGRRSLVQRDRMNLIRLYIEELNEWHARPQNRLIRLDVVQTLKECIRESGIFTENELQDPKINSDILNTIQQVDEKARKLKTIERAALIKARAPQDKLDREAQKVRRQQDKMERSKLIKAREQQDKLDRAALEAREQNPKLKAQDQIEGAALRTQLIEIIERLKKSPTLVEAHARGYTGAVAVRDISLNLTNFEKNLDENVKLLLDKRNIQAGSKVSQVTPLKFVLGNIVVQRLKYDKDLSLARVKNLLKIALKEELHRPISDVNSYQDSVYQLHNYILNLERQKLGSKVKGVFFSDQNDRLKIAKNLFLILSDSDKLSLPRLKHEIESAIQEDKKSTNILRGKGELGIILENALNEISKPKTGEKSVRFPP